MATDVPIQERLDARLTISVPEAARLLGISRTTAYRAAHAGQLPCIVVGGRLLVPVAALLALLNVTT